MSSRASRIRIKECWVPFHSSPTTQYESVGDRSKLDSTSRRGRNTM
jgi:hypothetical protein